MNLKSKDPMFKLAISLVAIALAYLVLSHLVTPLFIHEPGNPLHELIPQGTEFASSSISIVAILLSVATGLFVAHYLGLGNDVLRSSSAKKRDAQKSIQNVSHADLDVLKKMMTEDEKKLVEEVEKAGEITQDSLRLRLDWSKAKVSTVLSILDRQGVVQKERSGKKYRVRLDPSLAKKTT